MVTVQSRLITIGLCIIGAIWLLVAQTIGSTWLLWPCLICFLAFIAWSALQGMALPVLLFFLPFAALLKLRPGMISFFTIALLIVYAVCTVRGIKNVNVTHMVPGIALLVLTLVVKTLYGESVDNGFVLFFASILLIPFFKRELNEEKYDFYYLTACFTAGIVIAGVSSRYLIAFSTIGQYVRRLDYSGVVRWAGFYHDPNYYSAHAALALGGVMILMLNGSNKRRIIATAIMAVFLLYCGALSVSKSFLVIVATLLLFWLFAFMLDRGRLTAKITILLTILVGTVFLLASTVFNDQVAMFLTRLSLDETIADFTTGRTDIWRLYLSAFKEDTWLLLFGRGLSDSLIGDRYAHNTVIQGVYQFGLLGFAFLCGWFICLIRILLSNISFKWNHFSQVAVLVVGAFGAWLGLDMLLFDEFFLAPLYVCSGLMFLNRKDTNTDISRSDGAKSEMC